MPWNPLQVMSETEASSRSWSYKILCSGGVSEKKKEKSIDYKDSYFMIFFRDVVARLLNKKSTKTFILFFFFTYLVFMVLCPIIWC